MTKKYNPWLDTMIEKHGSKEAVQEYMKSIGGKGGKNSNTGGFAVNGKASSAGAVGGKKSRIGYKYLYTKGKFHYYTNKKTGEEERMLV